MKFNEGGKVFGRDHNLAIQYFDEAIKLDSNFIPPYLQKAVAYMNQGKAAIADSLLQLTEKRFSNPPKNEGYSIKLARHLLNGNMEREFEYIKKIFELDPKSLATNYQMGQTAVRYNRPQTTVDAYSLLNPESIQWEGQNEILVVWCLWGGINAV